MKEKSKEIVFFDIETFDFIGTNKIKLDFEGKDYLIGCLNVNNKEYKTFYQASEFLDYLENLPSKYVVAYAHNFGGFDFRVIINDIIKRYKDKITIVPINSHILININLPKKRIMFRDTWLLFPASLKHLTHSFNIVYKKKEIDYDECNYYEMEKYLEYDVKSLHEVYFTFQDQINEILTQHNKTRIYLSDYMTLAQLSFSLLHMFLKNKKATKNYLSKNQENWVRKAYYGGRTEVFKRYGKNLYYYDVNSLYPFVMTFPMPTGKFFETDNPDIIKRSIEKDLMGIIEADVKTPSNLHIPVLPIKFNGKLIFPLGKFSGVWTSKEIKLALKYNYKFKFKKAIFWTNKECLFKDFVKTFYHLKENSKGIKRMIAKLILNSSYGKFGQRRKKKIISFNPLEECEVLAAGDIKIYTIEKETYENRNINPVFAVFITSYARIVLYSLFEAVGFEHIYYCDTDSIITDVPLHASFIHPTNLGKLSEEDKIKEGIFISPKTYAYINENNETITKCKGFKNKVFAYENYEDILFNGKEIVKEERRLVGFFEKFRRKQERKDSNFLKTIFIQKHLKDNYDKRIVLDDRISTKPLGLSLVVTEG